MRKVMFLVAGALLVLSLNARAEQGLSGLPAPVDPESWTLPQWMTWNDYRQVPGINWNDADRQPAKKLRSAFILGDFSDRDFIVTMPKGSDIFGIAGVSNPVGAGSISRDHVGDFYADLHVRKPQTLNHFHTVNEYWLEDSFGVIGVDATAFGPYRMTGKEHEYGLGGSDAGGAADACPKGDSCGQSFDNQLIQASLADVTTGIAANGEDYDFRFLLHAGYDESGVWAEFGPMMFPRKADVAEVLGNPDESKPNWAETRYVDWTSFASAEGIWSHAVPGVTSTQGENDGAAVFAHELSHIFGVLDNYNNPYAIPVRRAYTGPWEMLSRGSFNGPGGPHARWQIPPTLGATMGSHHMLRNKMRLGFIKPNEVLEQPKEALAASGPLFATIYPRAYPLAPVTADSGLHGIHLLIGNDQTPACDVDKQYDCDGGGYTSYTVEVVDRIGYDSFTPDHGVLIAKNIDVVDANAPFEWAIDAHPQDINKRQAPPPNSHREIFDYYQPTVTPAGLQLPLSGRTVPITLGDPRQLADALFHAGTGPGVVSEFVDEPNGLHFYVLGTQLDARGVRNYRVAVRALAGSAPVTRGLELVGSAGGSAAPGRVAVARFKVQNTGLTTDLVRLTPKHAQGWTAHLDHNVIELGAGETAEIPVYVAVPGAASAGTSVVRFTATSETGNDISVQGETEVRVVGAPRVASTGRRPVRGSAPSLPGTGVSTPWLAAVCLLTLAALLDRARRRYARRSARMS
jgi:M6 family metalloprotease-like protein